LGLAHSAPGGEGPSRLCVGIGASPHAGLRDPLSANTKGRGVEPPTGGWLPGGRGQRGLAKIGHDVSDIYRGRDACDFGYAHAPRSCVREVSAEDHVGEASELSPVEC
jgi:hypothetical protein